MNARAGQSEVIDVARMIPSKSHATLIARTELRRKRRALAGRSRWQLVIVALSALFFLLPVAAVTFGAYVLGEGLHTGAIDLPLSLLRGGVGGVVLFVAFIAGSRTVQTSGTLDRAAGVLTAVAHRDAVAGLLLTELGLFLAVGTLPTLAIAVAFAVGANAPMSAVPVVVAALGIILLGVVLGYSLGLVVKIAFARSPILAKHKSAIGALVFIAYFGVAFTGSFNSAFAPVLGVLERSPVGWFVDLTLVNSPGVAVDIVRAAGAVCTVVAGVPLLVGVSVLLAERLWFSESVQPSVERDEGASFASTTGPSSPETNAKATLGTRSTLSTRLFGELVSQPVLRIAQKNWRRARRAPLKLWYAAYPLLLVGFQIGPIFDTGRVPGWLVLFIAICGAWATGAAFGLNPFGDEGAVLPLTLTSSVSGRQYLAGTVLSGVAAGVPVTIVATAGLGVLSPLSPPEIAGVAALGVVLCVGASVLAAGVGSLYPNFEETNITRNRTAVRPSIMAFLVYTMGLFGVGLPGVVAQNPDLLRALAVLGMVLLSGFPDVIASGPSALDSLADLIEATPAATVIGIGITGVIATGVAVLASRRLVHTFNDYTL